MPVEGDYVLLNKPSSVNNQRVGIYTGNTSRNGFYQVLFERWFENRSPEFRNYGPTLLVTLGENATEAAASMRMTYPDVHPTPSRMPRSLYEILAGVTFDAPVVPFNGFHQHLELTLHSYYSLNHPRQRHVTSQSLIGSLSRIISEASLAFLDSHDEFILDDNDEPVVFRSIEVIASETNNEVETLACTLELSNGQNFTVNIAVGEWITTSDPDESEG
jgi:hypothetical protein